MATANERLASLGIRNQVNVLKYTEGQLGDIRKLLKEAEIDLTGRLWRANTKYGKARLKDMLNATSQYAREIEKQLFEYEQVNLLKFGQQQAGQAFHDLNKTLGKMLPPGLGVSLTTPDFGMIAKAATSQPLHGKLLKEWWKEWGTGVKAAVTQQIRLGIVENEGIDQMVRRLLGSQARNFKDGILDIKRRHAEALVRTATNSVATAAKNEVYEANSDVIDSVQWNSTLDGSTTPICMARDGKRASIGGRGQAIPASQRLKPPSARPPAHVNCRSTIVPVISDWKSLGLDDPPASTRASMNGQVPDKMDYGDFLRKEAASGPAGLKFVQDTLGKAKAELFLKGKLPLTKFVTEAGRSLSLADLKRLQPKAWKIAFAGKGGMNKPVPKIKPKPAPVAPIKKAAPAPKPAPKPAGKTQFGGLMPDSAPGPAWNSGGVTLKVMNNAKHINTPDKAAAWCRNSSLKNKVPHEYGAILDKNNRLWDARRGGEGSISYKLLFGYADELKGGKYFHSHPGAGALSGADLHFAMHYEIGTMTAVGVEAENYFMATAFKKAKAHIKDRPAAFSRVGNKLWRSIYKSKLYQEFKSPVAVVNKKHRAGGYAGGYAEYIKAYKAALKQTKANYIAGTIIMNQLLAKWGGFTFSYTLQAGLHSKEVRFWLKKFIDGGMVADMEALHKSALTTLKGTWDG